MKIVSDDTSSELLIESCCCEIANYPSLCFYLELKTEDVSGRLHEVWIEGEVVARFLKHLKRLDASRKEFATLQSMRPDEFAMTLFPLDSLGHIGLK